MKTVITKSISNPVILMKILEDNTLLVVDAETTVRYLDKETLALNNGFKVGITHRYYKTSVVDFSNDGNYFTTITSDAKESRLFNAKTKKLIAKVDRHHGEVSCVAIDPLSQYMFSCGDDGKTFATDVRNGKLVFTLPHHKDTINCIACSEQSTWVATGSYDRKISLFSLVTMTPKNKLKAHAAAVMYVHFFHKKKLLSIDKQSSAIIWDIYTGKVLSRLKGIHDTVTAFVVDSEENFLFLGTELGYIIVYDLESYELISEKYIKLTSTITSLLFDAENDYLIIGTEDGFILYYDIFEGADTLESLLKKREFGFVQKVIDENPLLVYTNVYDILTNFWEISLKKAKLALQKGDKKKALSILQEFKHMPSKNKIIQKLIKDYESFPQFLQFIKEGKLSLAYGLVNRFPVYKESDAYKIMEKRWKKAFMQAQKYLLEPKTAPLAKEILAPYRGVSEKTQFIQELLSKSEIYKRFRNAIAKKEFKICSELIKKNAFLRELPEYETLMKFADNLYIKSQKFIEEGDLHSAIKILRVLVDFEEFKEEAKNLLDNLEAKAKFFNAVLEEDIETAYNMMAVSEDLIQTKEGKALQDMWNSDLQRANAAAAHGDIQKVISIMQKYMKISSKYVALATLFSFAYMVQLEDALQRGEERLKIEKGIKNYIVNFGLSEQIEAFFHLFEDQFPETKLNLELLSKGSFAMWRPSMIVDSILES